MPRPLRWTDDELREAVAVSRSLNEVARRLGISVGGATYASLRRHMARLGLETSDGPSAVGARRALRAWGDDDSAMPCERMSPSPA